MNRYTYKAKRKDNQEWVYGSLIIEKSSSMCLQEYGIPFIETYYIYTIEDGNNRYSKIEIKKETLCQCTGLQDIEGNHIFENDVLLVDMENDKYEEYVVVWDKKELYFDAETEDNFIIPSHWHKDKIIGNKFDEVKEWKR